MSARRLGCGNHFPSLSLVFNSAAESCTHVSAGSESQTQQPRGCLRNFICAAGGGAGLARQGTRACPHPEASHACKSNTSAMIRTIDAVQCHKDGTIGGGAPEIHKPFHCHCCPRACHASFTWFSTLLARLRSLNARTSETLTPRRASLRFFGTLLFARRNVPTVSVCLPAGRGARTHSRAREPTEGPPVVWREIA
jgi:hypothetical protein